jgi:hypothetical protein
MAQQLTDQDLQHCFHGSPKSGVVIYDTNCADVTKRANWQELEGNGWKGYI